MRPTRSSHDNRVIGSRRRVEFRQPFLPLTHFSPTPPTPTHPTPPTPTPPHPHPQAYSLTIVGDNETSVRARASRLEWLVHTASANRRHSMTLKQWLPYHREAMANADALKGRSVVSHQSSVISHQSSVISHQSSVISHQSSVTSHQSSAIRHQPSAISHQSSAISHQSSVISLPPM